MQRKGQLMEVAIPFNTCCENGPPGGACYSCTATSEAYQRAMFEPRAVCAACQTVETHWLEPVCDDCRAALEASGVLKPKDQRIQIGPLDV